MKKLSTIIALALVITIGGVYAAWNYSQGTANGAVIERKLNMASIVSTTSKGTITADTTGFTLLVDDDANDGKTHCAVLNATGHIAVVFAANEGADASVAEEGIPMIATITVTKAEDAEQVTPDGEDQAVDILAPAVDNVVEVKRDADNDNDLKTGWIMATDIAQALVFCGGGDVYLNDLAENQAFAVKMAKYTIVITISEGVKA